MKKRKLPLPMVLGVCLVLVSLGLMLAFQIRLWAGVRKSQTVASQMDRILPERTQGAGSMYPQSPMPVLEIDGADYVALLEIPAFGITLPVADKWDTKNLSSGPARFWGSVYGGTLVVGGTDYPGQFGFCDRIENDTPILLTDMTGAQFSFRVSRVDRAKQAQTQWLTNPDYDLTLFCRDVYSMEYIAVRCVAP